MPTTPFDPTKATRLNPAAPPDWRWRVKPLLDERADAERPEPIRPLGHRLRPGRRATSPTRRPWSTPTRRSPPATSTPSATCATPARSSSAATSACAGSDQLADGAARGRPRGVHRVHRPGQAGGRGAQGRAVPVPDGLARTRDDEDAAGAAARSARSRSRVRRRRMAERTFFQTLAGEAVDFFEFVDDLFGRGRRPARRSSRISAATRAPRPGDAGVPAAPLESIKAYRDAATPAPRPSWPSLADVLLLLDAIASNIEAVGAGDDLGAGARPARPVAARPDRQQLRAAALPPPVPDHAGGVGDRGERRRPTAPARTTSSGVGSSLQDRRRVPVQPGQDARRPRPGRRPDRAERARQLRSTSRRRRRSAPRRRRARLDARQRAWNGHHGRPARRLGRPRARHRLGGRRRREADVISNQMVSFSLRHGVAATFERDAEDGRAAAAQLAYVPADDGGPGLFVAFGGHLETEQSARRRAGRSRPSCAATPVSPRCSAGAARVRRCPSTTANFAASVGWASRPDPTTQLTYAVPRADR